MTVGWAAYVLAVSGLIALAARAAASALRLLGRPVRGVWAAALAATAAVPLWPRLLPGGDGAAGGAGGTVASPGSLPVAGLPRPDGAVPGGDGAVAEAVGAVSAVLSTPLPDALGAGLAVAWAAASAGLLVTLAGGWLRLRRRCRAWPVGRVAGEDVRVSRATGPAAAGLLRPVVIVPAWLLRRGGVDVRMAVLHEREHARAGDPALLAAGRALAAIVPWNPLLWWQLRRLRLAVELDCDRRVLRRGPSRRDYGRLLLEVSASPSGGFLRPAATLSERSTDLEERIRAMTSDSTPRFSGLRSVLLVGLALGLIAGACETPPPPGPAGGESAAPEVAAEREAGAGEAGASADRDSEEDASAGSTFRIRGASGIGAQDRPMIYIDGVRVEGSGEPGWLHGDGAGPPEVDLDPEDIESIEILKGERAVAEYGPDAASGVLLITTKSGPRSSR